MRSFLAALLFASLAAPALAEPQPSPTPASPLSHHGFVTERAAAERAISFRPFLPDPRPVSVALEPPFHGDDRLSVNEGIAYAYDRHGRTWLFTQWPRNGGSLAAFGELTGFVERGCSDVHAIGGATKPRGVLWVAPHGMVMSLMPDGSADRRTLAAEWHRLARRGACR